MNNILNSRRSRIFYVQTLTFGSAFALQWSIFITANKMLTKLGYLDKVKSDSHSKMKLM